MTQKVSINYSINLIIKRMKKLFMLTLALLLPYIGARAQANHWSFDANAWQDETIIWTQLVDNSGNPISNPRDYDVAAFITETSGANAGQEQIRGIGQFKGTDMGEFFLFRVKGEMTDYGKSITFKAYNRTTGVEFDLTMKEEPLPTWTGETLDPGIPSNSRKLYVTEPASVSLPQTITINKGESIDLTDYITVLPEGAPIPNNLIWEAGHDAIKVVGNILTGLTPTGPDGAYLELRIGDTESAMTTSTYIIVNNPATGIAIKEAYQEITVNKNDWETLTYALNNAVTLTPSDATDQVVWAIADENIVEVMTNYPGWNPKAGGTTTMTAQILNANNTVRLSATLTVHVNVPVEAVETAEWFNFSQGVLYCNVGDDLTDIVNKIFVVTPQDATNKGLIFSMNDETETPSAITIDAQGHITATAPGWVQILATSVENPNLVGSVSVDIANPAKTISVAETPLRYNYKDTSIDISEDVAANISFGPAGYTAITGLTLSSSNPSVVTASANYVVDTNQPRFEASVVGSGEAWLTATLEYYDYMSYYNAAYAGNSQPLNNFMVEINNQFKVVVTQGLSGFEIDYDRLAFGEEGVVRLTPIPDDAEFDPDLVTIHIIYGDAASEWEQSFTGGTLTNNELSISVTPHLPGMSAFIVEYNGESVAFGDGVVLMPFSYTEGWQWRTLNYGYLEPGRLEECFGNKLVEIRSQNELMYNDPLFGYFGELADAGLSQNTFYKIKTNAASDAPYYLANGNIEYDNLIINLQQGYTWVPNPYFYERSLSAVSGRFNSLYGIDGFATYNGQNSWTGSLQTLEPQQAYMARVTETVPGQQDFINFANELAMGPGSSTATPAPQQSLPMPWQYSTTEYADNMYILAKAENVSDMAAYTVGAFVNGECRGKGTVADGLLYITVHGKSGEKVTFQFHNPFTNEYFDAVETVTFRSGAEMTDVAMPLTKIGEATGITTVDSELTTGNAKIYNANGAEQRSLQRGVNIVRQDNGTVRKVVKK